MIDINKAQEVYSSLGKINTTPTARVAKNEWIWTPPKDGSISLPATGNYRAGKDHNMLNIGDEQDGGAASKVTTGKVGQDTNLANVGQEDVIFGGLYNWRTGTKYQDDPVLNTMAGPMLSTLNKMEQKMNKAHEKHGWDQFAINTKRVWDNLAKPMKGEANKYLANLAKDQADDRDAKNAMEQYEGLMMANKGKDYMMLPGFKYGEANPITAAKNQMNAISASDIDHIMHSTNDQDVANMVAQANKYGPGNTIFDYSNDKIGQFIYDESDRLYRTTHTPKEKYNNSFDNYGPYKINPTEAYFINGLGLLASTGEFYNAAHQRISTPNVYRSNPYARQALAGMSQVRYDPTWIREAMLSNRRNSAYRLNNQGGLTAGQRYMGRIAADLGTNEQFAKIDQNMQELNNKYKFNYYQALQNAGDAEQKARMTAASKNYEYYRAAHNAREQYKQMALRNLMDYLTQGYKDATNAKMYNGMRSLYWQDMKNRREDNAAQRANDLEIAKVRGYNG